MILGLTPEGGGTADAEGPHRTPVKALRGMGCRVGRSQGSTFALGPSTQGWGPGLRSLPALAPHPTLVLKRHPALLSLDRNYDLKGGVEAATSRQGGTTFVDELARTPEPLVVADAHERSRSTSCYPHNSSG